MTKTAAEDAQTREMQRLRIRLKDQIRARSALCAEIEELKAKQREFEVNKSQDVDDADDQKESARQFRINCAPNNNNNVTDSPCNEFELRKVFEHVDGKWKRVCKASKIMISRDDKIIIREGQKMLFCHTKASVGFKRDAKKMMCHWIVLEDTVWKRDLFAMLVYFKRSKDFEAFAEAFQA